MNSLDALQPIFRILAINPGSTSTKIALYENQTLVLEETIRHSNQEVNRYPNILDQRQMRLDCVLDSLKKHNIPLSSLMRGGRARRPGRAD